MTVDRTIVALLGPDINATCTTPACGYPDPCEECEDRRHRRRVRAWTGRPAVAP